jgi:hypothetical protein
MKILMFVLAAASAAAQAIIVSDTIVSATGVLFQGRITIQPLRLTYLGVTYSNNAPTLIDVGHSGTFSVSLIPTINATPANQLYRVDYRSTRGAAWTEYWEIPETGAPLKLTNVVKNYTPAPTGSMAVTQIDGARNASGKYICSDGSRYINCDPPASAVQTFSRTFTNATSVAISDHGLGTSNLVVTIYDSIGRTVLAPVSIGSASPFAVTVTFTDAMTGRLAITRAPSDSESFTAATTVTIYGAVHGLGTANLAGACFDSSGAQFLYGSLIVDPSTFDASFTFAQAATGRCLVQGGR